MKSFMVDKKFFIRTLMQMLAWKVDDNNLIPHSLYIIHKLTRLLKVFAKWLIIYVRADCWKKRH